MAWTMLVVAGLLEVVWAVSLKRTEGFTRLWPSVLTVAAMIASFLLLARAMTHLPTGVAYAVWVGIGVVGAALVSATLMGERLSGVQVAFLALIAVGIVGLRLATPGQVAGVEASGADSAVNG
ncbi:MAG: multidrug efflux SMR transporter [Phycisphaerales bacterium]|nr:multidrug efflux SMR transporter [Phycisphaerales bacterium]MCB9840631.1 multidrug efflux SMR transporter [Phycisphaeraceae bacterium]